MIESKNRKRYGSLATESLETESQPDIKMTEALAPKFQVTESTIVLNMTKSLATESQEIEPKLGIKMIFEVFGV